MVVVAAGNSGPVRRNDHQARRRSGRAHRRRDERQAATRSGQRHRYRRGRRAGRPPPASPSPTWSRPAAALIATRSYGSYVESEQSARADLRRATSRARARREAAAVTSGVVALLLAGAARPDARPGEGRAHGDGVDRSTASRSRTQGRRTDPTRRRARRHAERAAATAHRDRARLASRPAAAAPHVVADCDGVVDRRSPARSTCACQPWDPAGVDHGAVERRRLDRVDVEGQRSGTASAGRTSRWSDATWDGVSWKGGTWTVGLVAGIVSWNGASPDSSTWTGVSWKGSTWTGVSWKDSVVEHESSWTTTPRRRLPHRVLGFKADARATSCAASSSRPPPTTSRVATSRRQGADARRST